MNGEDYPRLVGVIKKIEEDAIAESKGEGEFHYYTGDPNYSPQVTAILEALSEERANG